MKDMDSKIWCQVKFSTKSNSTSTSRLQSFKMDFSEIIASRISNASNLSLFERTLPMTEISPDLVAEEGIVQLASEK